MPAALGDNGGHPAKLKEPHAQGGCAAAAKARFEGIGLLPERVLLGAMWRLRRGTGERRRLSGRGPDPVEADKQRRPIPSAHQPQGRSRALSLSMSKARCQARRQWERGVVEVDYVVVLAR